MRRLFISRVSASRFSSSGERISPSSKPDINLGGETDFRRKSYFSSLSEECERGLGVDSSLLLLSLLKYSCSRFARSNFFPFSLRLYALHLCWSVSKLNVIQLLTDRRASSALASAVTADRLEAISSYEKLMDKWNEIVP